MLLSHAGLTLAGLGLVVAIGDLRYRRVPNSLIVVCLLAWLVLKLAATPSLPTSAAQSALAMLVALVVFVPLWKAGAMGAGDVKFLAVLGVWFGLAGLFVCWVVASLIALLHGLYGHLSGQARVPDAGGARRGAPYAAFLVVGAWLWLMLSG